MEKPEVILRQIERNPRLSGQVESQLFEAIQKNVFLAGDYLPSEHELTKIFGVSRSVIREALLKLSARGIIDVQKGKGAQVLKPSLDHVLDPFSRFVNFRCGDEAWLYVLKVRQILETQTVALAAEFRSDKDLEDCSQSILEMKRSVDSKVSMIDCDITFHQTLARASQNPLVPIVLRPLFDVIAKFHAPVFNDAADIERTVKAHESILEAVARKDATAARLAMEAHLKEAEEIIRYKLRDKSPREPQPKN